MEKSSPHPPTEPTLAVKCENPLRFCVQAKWSKHQDSQTGDGLPPDVDLLPDWELYAKSGQVRCYKALLTPYTGGAALSSQGLLLR